MNGSKSICLYCGGTKILQTTGGAITCPHCLDPREAAMVELPKPQLNPPLDPSYETRPTCRACQHVAILYVEAKQTSLGVCLQGVESVTLVAPFLNDPRVVSLDSGWCKRYTPRSKTTMVPL